MCWSTNDEIRFVQALAPELVWEYAGSLKLRKDWKNINKQRVAAIVYAILLKEGLCES